MAQAQANVVDAFREHARALEASLSVCLGGANRKHVHELRSGCTRLEADLEILEKLKGLPPDDEALQAVVQEVQRLRRAAGKVRDFDALRKLLKKEFVERKTKSAAAAVLQKQSQELRKIFKRNRKRAAAKLLSKLEKHQAHTASALETLLKALESVGKAAALSLEDLLEAVDQDLHQSGSLNEGNATAVHLHALRKLAKRGRYKAEIGAAFPRARGRAEELHNVQQLGGDWHDWLRLAELAHTELGQSKHATIEFSRREALSRRRYRKLLVRRSLLGSVTEPA